MRRVIRVLRCIPLQAFSDSMQQPGHCSAQLASARPVVRRKSRVTGTMLPLIQTATSGPFPIPTTTSPSGRSMQQRPNGNAQPTTTTATRTTSQALTSMTIREECT